MVIPASTPTSSFMVTVSASSFKPRASLVPGGHVFLLGVVGGSTISNADVATYEAGIGVQTSCPGFQVIFGNRESLWIIVVESPLHLWDDSVLEEVGKALCVFIMTNTASLKVVQMMYSHVLVEFEITKELLEMIFLESPLGAWNILLFNEGIRFHCRKCHLTGHLAAHFSSSKTR